MKVRVIDKSLEDISKMGIPISAGTSNTNTLNSTVQLSYPAGAAAAMARDIPNMQGVNNGLILSVFKFNNGTYQNLRGIQNKHSVSFGSIGVGKANNVTQSGSLATILMPQVGYDRSLNNKFNDNRISKWERGNNSLLGMIGPVASDIVSGMMERVTGGINADNNEQISTAGRSTYAGTDQRTFTFTWEIVPKNADDLIALAQIYHVLMYFAVGITRKGMKVTEDITSIIQGLQEKGAEVVKNGLGGKEVKTNNTIATSLISEILNNTITVSNPYYWNIRKYDSQGADLLAESYAPCQIQNITLSDPSGPLNGFYLAPSMSSKYTLSVTFRELIALTHGGI